MKKLVKSDKNRQICGVCSGLGEYFGVDATVFRLIFAVLAVLGGSGILLYFIAAVIMPKEPEGSGRRDEDRGRE